jgi:hypothetical protein
MLLMLLGILTLVRLRCENAELPILVTGKPFIVLGMSTTASAPVYSVIVRAPP